MTKTLSASEPLSRISDYEFMNIAGWENMYRSGERGSEDHPTQLLIDTVAALQPGAAIDLACGSGRNTLFLAELGWRVTAIDGSSSAIATLRERAAQRGLSVNAQVSDLTAPGFMLPDNSFQLVLIAYYLQRDLFAKIAPTLQPGGITIAIVHIPGPGEQLTANRTSPGELKMLFAGWDILHYYEGASRDPAHKRPVAEIVAQRQARK